MVKLLSRCANVNARNKDNATPLILTVSKDCYHDHAPALVRLLLEAGADMTAKDKYGKSAWRYATENSHVGVEILFGEHLNALQVCLARQQLAFVRSTASTAARLKSKQGPDIRNGPFATACNALPYDVVLGVCRYVSSTLPQYRVANADELTRS